MKNQLLKLSASLFYLTALTFIILGIEAIVTNLF